ncbi:serine/threonine-protein kinase [Pseudonocardia sp. CA-142604]|uniref:serine/threonine-protein kinase n=1 Tax=Pseudonocardia sp. CA-142604 TaxID=3240024 RepID=UPI003D8A27F0
MDDPRQVGPYSLLGRLGSGGMGRVYLGRSRSGRQVAVKVVKQELLDQDGSFRPRFRREVEAAKAVGGFWTAAIVDSDADATPPWYASAFIDAPTLHDVVTGGGPLSVPDALSLGAGLAEALTAIHKADLIHRDLKPSNVLMAPDGPRVIDFGIARVVAPGAAPLTATGWRLGTIGYLAPELLRGGSPSAASDVFAFGVLIVFATTGHLPFAGSTDAEVVLRTVGEPPDLSGVDGRLVSVATGCLAKDPAERPDVRELLDLFAAPRDVPAGGAERSGTRVLDSTRQIADDPDTAQSGDTATTVGIEPDARARRGSRTAPHYRSAKDQPWSSAWGAALATAAISFGQLTWFASAPWAVAGPSAAAVMVVALLALRAGQVASPTVEKRGVWRACVLLSISWGAMLAVVLVADTGQAWWTVTLFGIGAVVALLASCSVLSELLAGMFDGPVPTSTALGLASGGLTVGLLTGVADIDVWFAVPAGVVVWVISGATISWIAAIGYLPFDEKEHRTL